ncbi:MAG: sugar phosphate isomerase/epimerase [Clostridiales bacterium]|nr:sugar phosphate isomerase/epimerase [Clostridiales bacterium]
MKIGLSSYSLDREIEKGNMSLHGAIEWAAKNGAECMELVPFAFRFDDPQTGRIDTALIGDARRWAKDAGIELCNYSVLADLCKEGADFENEIRRICHEVDIAAELQVPMMRHDVSSFRRPHSENTLRDFEKWLPYMAEGAKRITEHGKKRGVKTLIENHGFFANGCDRVERIIDMVNDENYGLLLDTGNIACVDENPSVAAQVLAPRCKMVHLKDFYIRTRDPGDSHLFDCAGTWFRSRGGKYLRGAILAQGDLDIWEILGALKNSGYDGNIVIEFEGLEEGTYASSVGMMNARRIWNEV